MTVAVALWLPSVGAVGAAPAPAAAPYVVGLSSGTDARAVALSVGAKPNHIYRNALSGFSARLTPTQVATLQTLSYVESVDPDITFHAQATCANPSDIHCTQLILNGDRRVGATSSPTAHIDGVDQRVNADIAIIDSGIDHAHPDLNVVGGVNCQAPEKPSGDLFGHGTMVAGFAAAIDNGFGVVGIAPGARLWDVRVLGRRGTGTLSKIVCGLDWVRGMGATIDVANMSLLAPLHDDGHCGQKGTKPGLGAALHRAICAVVNAGVTVTAAAGNDATDAANSAPAAYDEVITVSAFADTDGVPGGLGPAPGCEPTARDDRFAFFSNFGPDVDISAPGVCVTSTYPGDQYAFGSGTSHAAPFVAGAVALYRATHPTATPAQVKAALLAAAEPGPVAGDPDAYPEPVLQVSSF